MFMNLEAMSMEEVFIISRYFYRIGNPILSDDDYDFLYEYFEKNNILKDYTSRVYDDDPVPAALLSKCGYLGSHIESSRDMSFLAEDKSLSIRKADSMRQVFDFCRCYPGQAKILSNKMDGNNVKSEVEDGKWKLSLTRGRASNGIDITEAMLKIIPKKIYMDGHRVVTGEVFLPPKYLEFVRNKYGNGQNIYKTSRSAALSFLRRPFDHEGKDYNLLDFRVFSCDGLNTTVSGTYQDLSKCGFKIPHYILIENEPEDFEQFSSWMTGVMDQMWYKQVEYNLPSDGLVLELDNLLFKTKIKDQYDERQIALKFYKWQSETYEGKITSIVVAQRRVFCCCKVTIDHVITSDGCSATTINTHNPSFLIELGLNVGDSIQFRRQSGAVNVMVNGKERKFETTDGNG